MDNGQGESQLKIYDAKGARVRVQSKLSKGGVGVFLKEKAKATTTEVWIFGDLQFS